MKRSKPTSAAASPSKQAVVYIIDTSPSMNQPYPSTDHHHQQHVNKTNANTIPAASQTRLDAAKEALIGLITDLMIKSKTNECAVIVLHTPDTTCSVGTRSNGDDGDNAGDHDENGCYSHMTQLSSVQRPTTDLLRTIQSISIPTAPDPTQTQSQPVPHRAGGFCDGIMLATSLIHQKTATKKSQRKIILFTDAEREVEIHWDKLDDTVGVLRGMNCDLTVIGLDFQRSAAFYSPADIENENTNGNGNANAMDSVENENGNAVSEDGDVNMEDDTDTTSSADKHIQARIKDDNEMFLISLTKYTGGQVHATHTIQQILKQAAGKRIPRSALSKIELQIAPGLMVAARISLSTTKQSLPTLKREAVVLDEEHEGEVKKDALGEIMSLAVTNVTSHWDADAKGVEVELINRSTGYPYGSDLIPIGPMEMEGLKLRSERRVTILGYIGLKAIPMAVWMGPTRIISGGSSRKACLAISALSQALWRKNQLAICTYVKTKDSDPCMGVLAPLVENSSDVGVADVSTCTSTADKRQEQVKPRHLLFVPMPFSDDMTNLAMNPLTSAIDESAEKICSDFIDAFTLPPDVLNSESIPNPSIRAFRKTMIQRAIDPNKNNDGICTARQSHDGDVEDPMVTPQYIVEKGRGELKKLRDSFPLKVVEHVASDGKKKKKYFFSESQDDL